MSAKLDIKRFGTTMQDGSCDGVETDETLEECIHRSGYIVSDFKGDSGKGASSWNDLKDKPFDVQTEECVLIAKQTMSFDETLEDVDGVYLSNLSVDEDFYNLLGSIYLKIKNVSIRWDGVEYSFPYLEPEMGNYSILYPIDDDSGEPFLIYLDDPAVVTKEAGQHTLEIVATIANVKTIDPIFMPCKIESSNLENEMYTPENIYIPSYYHEVDDNGVYQTGQLLYDPDTQELSIYGQFHNYSTWSISSGYSPLPTTVGESQTRTGETRGDMRNQHNTDIVRVEIYYTYSGGSADAYDYAYPMAYNFGGDSWGYKMLGTFVDVEGRVYSYDILGNYTDGTCTLVITRIF